MYTRWRTAARRFGSSSPSCRTASACPAPRRLGGDAGARARRSSPRARPARGRLRRVSSSRPIAYSRMMARSENVDAPPISTCLTSEASTSSDSASRPWPVPRSSPPDRLDRLEGEPGREDAEILEQRRAARRAAGRRSSRSWPASCGADRAGRARTPSASAGCAPGAARSPRGEEAHLRRGELDRQRQSLEAPADVRDGRGVLGGQGEAPASPPARDRRRARTAADRRGAFQARRAGALGRAAASPPRRPVRRGCAARSGWSPGSSPAGATVYRRTRTGAASTICSKLSSTISTRRRSSTREMRSSRPASPLSRMPRK